MLTKKNTLTFLLPLLGAGCFVSTAEGQCEEVDPQTVEIAELDAPLMRMDWPVQDSIAAIEGDLSGWLFVGERLGRGEQPPNQAVPLRVELSVRPEAILHTFQGALSCDDEQLDLQLDIELVHEAWGTVARGFTVRPLSADRQYEGILEFTSTLDPRVFDALGIQSPDRPSQVEFRGDIWLAWPDEGPTCELYGTMAAAEGDGELPVVAFGWAPTAPG